MDVLSRSNEHHLVIEIFAARCLSLYVCVTLLIKARYMFLPCQEWRDVLNSSSLTVASIVSLRGDSASYNVPWLAGMHGLFFVSIL